MGQSTIRRRRVVTLWALVLAGSLSAGGGIASARPGPGMGGEGAEELTQEVVFRLFEEVLSRPPKVGSFQPTVGQIFGTADDIVIDGILAYLMAPDDQKWDEAFKAVLAGGVKVAWVLDGIWAENSSAQKCMTAELGTFYWGKIRFVYDAQTGTFAGTWGYCDGALSWPWTGSRKP